MFLPPLRTPPLYFLLTSSLIQNNNVRVGAKDEHPHHHLMGYKDTTSSPFCHLQHPSAASSNPHLLSFPRCFFDLIFLVLVIFSSLSSSRNFGGAMTGHREVSSLSCFGSSAKVMAVLLLIVLPGACAAARPLSPESQSVEFIRSSCGTTQYPRLCFQTLSAYASTIQTSPMQLAHVALSVSLDGARSTSAAMARMVAGAGMRPREAAAMKDCVEEMGDSVGELRRSVGEMGKLGDKGQNLGFQIGNIQTWVSAALTEDGTCMDGFAGKAMDGGVKAAVRGQIVNVAQLTSNALALVNALVSSSP